MSNKNTVVHYLDNFFHQYAMCQNVLTKMSYKFYVQTLLKGMK